MLFVPQKLAKQRISKHDCVTIVSKVNTTRRIRSKNMLIYTQLSPDSSPLALSECSAKCLPRGIHWNGP